jgi:hypothetical protein
LESLRTEKWENVRVWEKTKRRHKNNKIDIFSKFQEVHIEKLNT